MLNIKINFLKYLKTILNKFVLYSYISNKENILIIQKKGLKKILYFLKKHTLTQFSILSDLCAVDYPTQKKRFELNYNLLSITYNERLRLKLKITETSTIDSIIEIYPSGNWFEREIWDMFGIFFKNNTDLRRILTDYGFEGYPLRKDFPLSGFVEIIYDENLKRIITKPIELSQKYRNFDIENNWNLNLKKNNIDFYY